MYIMKRIRVTVSASVEGRNRHEAILSPKRATRTLPWDDSIAVKTIPYRSKENFLYFYVFRQFYPDQMQEWIIDGV